MYTENNATFTKISRNYLVHKIRISKTGIVKYNFISFDSLKTIWNQSINNKNP